jgi:hypothetical protein
MWSYYKKLDKEGGSKSDSDNTEKLKPEEKDNIRTPVLP